jgi:hypothetical protein
MFNGEIEKQNQLKNNPKNKQSQPGSTFQISDLGYKME